MTHRIVKVRASERIAGIPKTNRYPCPYCPKKYDTTPGLGNHLLVAHPGRKIPRVDP
jgi:hypothetical protein